MSLGEFIKWCSCGRMILRTCQIKDGQCDLCLKEHAQTLKERLEKMQDTKEFQ